MSDFDGPLSNQIYQPYNPMPTGYESYSAPWPRWLKRVVVLLVLLVVAIVIGYDWRTAKSRQQFWEQAAEDTMQMSEMAVNLFEQYEESKPQGLPEPEPEPAPTQK